MWMGALADDGPRRDAKLDRRSNVSSPRCAVGRLPFDGARARGHVGANPNRMKLSSKFAPLALLLALGSSVALAAAGIDVAGMNRAVAPGEDFYAFANGTWLEKTEIPADRGS